MSTLAAHTFFHTRERLFNFMEATIMNSQKGVDPTGTGRDLVIANFIPDPVSQKAAREAINERLHTALAGELG